MTDPVSTARTARENLARGLAALQGPGVPPALMDVAEPVAEAMSALHRVEASQGGALPEAAPSALQAVRRALGMLQSQPLGIAAVDQAMEAVAGSLSLVHTLNQLLVSAPAAQVAPVPQVAAAPANPLGATVALGDAYPQAPAAPVAQPAYPAQPAQPGFPGAPTTAYGPPPNAYPSPDAAPAWPGAQQQQMPMPMQQQPVPQAPMPQPVMQPPAQAMPMQPPVAAPMPAAQQPASPWTQTSPAAPNAHAAAQQALGSAPQHAAPAPGSAPYHAPPPGPEPYRALQAPPDALRVEAELGAHSATNFYKGLSGNDVIDSGGIFIATYKIPDIGQNLVIKVSLPGGYEFEALGVVQWTRDAPHSTAGSEVPPGFGARFTQITPEGRQLVYRYVRNREPLFHDDL